MEPSDIIFITDLRADAIIGIYARERTVKQTISVDLELSTSVKDAAKTDSVDNTLNYKLLSKRVEACIQQSEFQLVETLAEHLASIIMDEFHVPWLKLTLHKVGALSNSRDVGVRIIRQSTP